MNAAHTYPHHLPCPPPTTPYHLASHTHALHRTLPPHTTLPTTCLPRQHSVPHAHHPACPYCDFSRDSTTPHPTPQASKADLSSLTSHCCGIHTFTLRYVALLTYLLPRHRRLRHCTPACISCRFCLPRCRLHHAPRTARRRGARAIVSRDTYLPHHPCRCVTPATRTFSRLRLHAHHHTALTHRTAAGRDLHYCHTAHLLPQSLDSYLVLSCAIAVLLPAFRT